MVAKDRSGCCVVQACLDHTQGELRKRIVTEIIANAIQLAEDPYGFVSIKLYQCFSSRYQH